MTHVDDLHEGDDREPDEDERWAPGVVPVNLDEVEQRLERLSFLAPPLGIVATRAELDGTEDLADLRDLIGHDVPGLVADLRHARQRIAEWEALETREEWATTPDQKIAPNKNVPYRVTPHHALKEAQKGQRQVWRRMLSVHPWEPIDADAPF